MAKSKTKGWNNPPPVLAISGDHTFLVRRELNKALKAAAITGRRVEFVDGEDPDCLEDILTANVFFGEKIMAIVENPEKLPPGVIEARAKSEAQDVVAVLYHPKKIRAKTKFKAAVDALDTHIELVKPKPWEEEEHAVSFCVGEAKRRGKNLSEKIATALVKACGTDLGFLSFEVLKLCVYLDSLGEDVVKVPHVKALLSSLHEASAFPVVDALAARDERRLLKSLNAVRRTRTSDPTMLVCALAGSNAVQWLHALTLQKAGVPSNVACTQVGVTSFRFDRSLIPAGKRWGEHGLARLIRGVADVERAVRTGKMHPWIMLESQLVSLCKGTAGSG